MAWTALACKRCGGPKPVIRARQYCDPCQKVRRKETVAAHRASGKHAATTRARYHANKESVRAYHREWYRKHADELRERNRGKQAERYQNTPLGLTLWRHARERAETKGVPFSITVDDIVVPDVCPVLGLTLARGVGRAQPNSPTLDRIVPSLGYVPGNIAVISYRANTLKSDASLDELEKLYYWLKGVN